MRPTQESALESLVARIDAVPPGGVAPDTVPSGFQSLDGMDARILTTIIEKFGGGPVGLGTVAVAVGEDAGTLQDVYEPFLIQQGFLERTPRGRCATALAYRRFGLTPPAAPQASIFDG